MDISLLTQYAAWILTAIGIMAFVVSVITQVIKEIPALNKLPTSVVVIALSLALCPIAFVAMMTWQKQPIGWQMIFACMIAAFVVALVSMGGWEKVSEIWNRTKYNKK